ncbi:MAG: protein-disulfide reductase DsbD domain-containing protein, partial [Pyrinomonadaceae bacterium]
MHRALIFRILFLIISLSLAAFSQSPARWSLSSSGQTGTIKAGETVKVILKADVDAGWHLYALEQPEGGPVATSIVVTQGSSVTISDTIASPKPIQKNDPLFTGLDGKPLVTKYYANGASFTVPLKASADIAIADVSLDVRFQLCNDTVCLPPKTVRVSLGGSEDVKRPSAVASAAAGSTPDNQNASVTNTVSNTPVDTDIWGFILLAIGAGLLSLLTPCVFPMIPITVSYFTNHAAGSRAKSIKLATIYSLGIIATFTILGMLLAIFVGAAGIQVLSANPWMNILIT